VQPSVER